MISIVLTVSFLFQSLPLSQLTPSTHSSISYACDAVNQQLTLGNKSMTYDLNGNLLTLADPSGTTTFTWNARNQLVGMSGPSVIANFQYDGLNRREVKTINGTTTEFLFDGINPVQEKGASYRGAWHRRDRQF